MFPAELIRLAAQETEAAAPVLPPSTAVARYQQEKIEKEQAVCERAEADRLLLAREKARARAPAYNPTNVDWTRIHAPGAVPEKATADSDPQFRFSAEDFDFSDEEVFLAVQDPDRDPTACSSTQRPPMRLRSPRRNNTTYNSVNQINVVS